MKLKLKIQLKGISKPPVWRVVIVPNGLTFSKLHLVIQATFGWENHHLYQFSPSGWRSDFCIEAPHQESDGLDASKIRLKTYLNTVGQKFVYIYDFGDGWEHEITVKETLPESDQNVLLLSGKGACPPEDCGGQWGYENLKIILADKKNSEHKEMKQWLGMKTSDVWDADAFEKQEAQAKLDAIFSAHKLS